MVYARADIFLNLSPAFCCRSIIELLPEGGGGGGGVFFALEVVLGAGNEGGTEFGNEGVLGAANGGNGGASDIGGEGS